MKTDDELLDEIAAYLRSQPVPLMPVVPAPKRTKQRRWLWLAAAAVALAASLGAVLWWRPLPTPAPGSGPQAPVVAEAPQAVPRGSGIVVLDADLSQPLAEIESGLDAIDAELAELRRQAALLDARREADRLLVRLETRQIFISTP